MSRNLIVKSFFCFFLLLLPLPSIGLYEDDQDGFLSISNEAFKKKPAIHEGDDSSVATPSGRQPASISPSTQVLPSLFDQRKKYLSIKHTKEKPLSTIKEGVGVRATMPAISRETTVKGDEHVNLGEIYIRSKHFLVEPYRRSGEALRFVSIEEYCPKKKHFCRSRINIRGENGRYDKVSVVARTVDRKWLEVQHRYRGVTYDGWVPADAIRIVDVQNVEDNAALCKEEHEYGYFSVRNALEYGFRADLRKHLYKKPMAGIAKKALTIYPSRNPFCDYGIGSLKPGQRVVVFGKALIYVGKNDQQRGLYVAFIDRKGVSRKGWIHGNHLLLKGTYPDPMSNIRFIFKSGGADDWWQEAYNRYLYGQFPLTELWEVYKSGAQITGEFESTQTSERVEIRQLVTVVHKNSSIALVNYKGMTGWMNIGYIRSIAAYKRKLDYDRQRIENERIVRKKWLDLRAVVGVVVVAYLTIAFIFDGLRERLATFIDVRNSNVLPGWVSAISLLLIVIGVISFFFLISNILGEFQEGNYNFLKILSVASIPFIILLPGFVLLLWMYLKTLFIPIVAWRLVSHGTSGRNRQFIDDLGYNPLISREDVENVMKRNYWQERYRERMAKVVRDRIKAQGEAADAAFEYQRKHRR